MSTAVTELEGAKFGDVPREWGLRETPENSAFSGSDTFWCDLHFLEARL